MSHVTTALPFLLDKLTLKIKGLGKTVSFPSKQNLFDDMNLSLVLFLDMNHKIIWVLRISI